MLARKTILCDELERIDAILDRLRERRRIGPDMSSDDLIELFREERDRLLAQLRAVDATLAAEAAEDTARQDARVIDFRRRGPAVPEMPDLS